MHACVYLLYEKAQCSKDMSKSGSRLIDLKEEQVGVKYFFHQRVLTFILLQLFLYRKRGEKAMDAKPFVGILYKINMVTLIYCNNKNTIIDLKHHY